MDLRVFAIMQKIKYNHKLLEYVEKNEPIPIDVLQDSLEDILTPLEHKQSQMLVDDYIHMLQEYVPVTYKQNSNGRYIIEGDIPDAVLESIHLVHHVTEKEAIEAMIGQNMQILGNRHVQVVDISLQESLHEMDEILASIPAVQSINEREEFDEDDYTHATETLMDAETHVETVQDEPTYEPIDEQVGMFISDIDDELIEEPIEEQVNVLTSDVEHDIVESDDEQDMQSDIKDVMRTIYTRIVDDIKMLNLDVALDINIH